MKLNEQGMYIPWVQPEYGFDASGSKVHLPKGFYLLKNGDLVMQGDWVFDVYSGWMQADNYLADNEYHAQSIGRWTAWARRKVNKLKLVK